MTIMLARGALLLVVCIILICHVGIHDGFLRRGLSGLRRWHSPSLMQTVPILALNHGGRANRYGGGDHCKTNYSFDYVQLTLIWPPGSCSTSPHPCEKEEDEHFTVHGMWPTIRGTQEPSFCCFDNTFDYHALEPIMKDMNEFWYSYFDHDSKKFWTHEWLKHGTCARDVKDMKGELRYFNTTLTMAKQLPILESLKKFNIVPNNGKQYSSSDILKALEPISQGKVVQIDCDLEHHQPIPVLTGLAFCFDSDLKPADCPASKPRCQRQLFFQQTSTKLKKIAY